MMINKFILKLTAVVLFFLGSTNVIAQEVEGDLTTAKKDFVASLSESQKIEFQRIKDDRKANKAAFIKTYSRSQKAIAKDKSLERRARRVALVKSFTDAQKIQEKTNKETHKSNMKAFQSSLSDAQKVLYDKARPKVDVSKMPKGKIVELENGKKIMIKSTDEQ